MTRGVPAFILLCGLSLHSARADTGVLAANPIERRIIAAIAEDILDKAPCVDTKQAATSHCRDAHSHVTTNEAHHEAYLPYLQRLGGIYLGVGSDQGLSFVANSGATLAFLFDYDPQVVLINKLHRLLILNSTSPSEFLQRWQAHTAKRTIDLIQRTEANGPTARQLVASYRIYRRVLEPYFRRVARSKAHQTIHWLRDGARYAYLRRLFQEGRIRILAGDLLKDVTMRSIAKAARALKLPVRLLYLSNAEEYWRYTRAFRANILALPFDERSLVLRTRNSKNGASFGRYQYVIQGGLDFQHKIAKQRYSGVWSMMREKRQTSQEGVYTLGLGTTPSAERSEL
jgi:hypothetical protein